MKDEKDTHQSINPLNVAVGDTSWQEAGVHFEDQHKDRLLQWLLILCIVAVLAMMLYGMLRNDAGILNDIFTLTRDIVIGILGWAIGRRHGVGLDQREKKTGPIRKDPSDRGSDPPAL